MELAFASMELVPRLVLAHVAAVVDSFASGAEHELDSDRAAAVVTPLGKTFGVSRPVRIVTLYRQCLSLTAPVSHEVLLGDRLGVTQSIIGATSADSRSPGLLFQI